MRLAVLMERLHIYAGLLSFTILLVFGVAGLHAVVVPDPRVNPDRFSDARYVDFDVPPDASDRELANRVHDQLGFITAGKMPDFALGRNSQHELVLDFWSVNGVTKVRVLEDRNQLEIRSTRTSLAGYLNNLHLSVPVYSPRNVVMFTWALYVELSIFTLLFLVASGVYLWLRTRRGGWWAYASFGLGSGVFIALWVLVR